MFDISLLGMVRKAVKGAFSELGLEMECDRSLADSDNLRLAENIGALTPHPGAREAVETLRASGFKIRTLTSDSGAVDCKSGIAAAKGTGMAQSVTNDPVRKPGQKSRRQRKRHRK